MGIMPCHAVVVSARADLQNALQVIEASPAFEKLVLVIIVANCIALTLFNPQDRDCLTSTCQDLQVSWQRAHYAASNAPCHPASPELDRKKKKGGALS